LHLSTGAAVAGRVALAAVGRTGEPDLFSAAAVILRAMLADRVVEDLHRVEARNAEAHTRAGPHRRIDVEFAGPPLDRANSLAVLAERDPPPVVPWTAALAEPTTDPAGPVLRWVRRPAPRSCSASCSSTPPSPSRRPPWGGLTAGSGSIPDRLDALTRFTATRGANRFPGELTIRSGSP
jgi:hypothetical protein